MQIICGRQRICSHCRKSGLLMFTMQRLTISVASPACPIHLYTTVHVRQQFTVILVRVYGNVMHNASGRLSRAAVCKYYSACGIRRRNKTAASSLN